MSDDADIQVTVTADVSGLTGPMKSASDSAKAAFDGMRISAADFSKALEAAGGDLRKVTLSANDAAAAARGTAAAMSSAAPAAAAAGAATATAATSMAAAETAATGLGHGAAGITRELIVLGGEAVRGNFSRIPGSLLVLTNRMNLLSLATIGPAAGIAAITAALALLIIRAAQAENAVESLQTSFQFRDVEASKDQISDLIDVVHKLPGATRADAEEVIRSFADMHHSSLPEIQGLANAVGDYATVTGTTAKEAGAALKRAFEDPLQTGEKLFASLSHVSDATRQQYEAAKTAGNENAAAAAMQKALNEALSSTTDALIEQRSAWSYSIENALAYISTLGDTFSVWKTESMLISQNTQEVNENAAARRAAITALANLPPPPAAVLQAGLDAGAHANPQRREMQDLQGDIGQITAALAVAKSTGNQVRLTQLNEDLAAAKEKLDTLQNGPAGSRQSAALDAILVKVTANARTTQQLEQEKAQETIKFWSDAAAQITGTDAKANEQRTADLAKANQARLQLQAETIRSDTAAEKKGAEEAKKTLEEQWRDYSAAAQEQIRAAQGNFAEQAKLAQAWVAEGKRLFGEHVANYKAASEELLTIARAQSAEQISIERQNVELAKQLMEINTRGMPGEFKVGVDLVLNPSHLAQQIQAQIAAATTGAQAELQLLADEMQQALSTNNQPAYNQAFNQSLVVQAQLAEQTAQINARAAQATQASWQKITNPITNALGSIADAAITGGRNSGQAMERAAVGIVQSFAKAALKAAADWITSELVKTAATETGVAVRTSTTVAGATAGAAAEKAAGSTTVVGDAYKAAAGTYASVAQIPIIGPVLAPPAAAAAFGAVMAFDSFDTGAWDLPQDQLAMVHKGEMIVPAEHAADWRSMMGGGSDPGKTWAPGVGSPGSIGDIGGSGGVINTGGNTSNNPTLHQTNNIHTGASASDVRAEMSRAGRDAHQQMVDYYGNTGVATLPGRSVRK